jgi:hypothetical protein
MAVAHTAAAGVNYLNKAAATAQGYFTRGTLTLRGLYFSPEASRLAT